MLDCLKVPRYVLRRGLEAIGPPITSHPDFAVVTAIYSFSDKSFYDEFVRESELGLTPYPLVKGFLHHQNELIDDGLTLLVLDATSPRQSDLKAATVQSVLSAFEQQHEHIDATHQLVRDVNLDTYRVQACVADADLSRIP